MTLHASLASLLSSQDDAAPSDAFRLEALLRRTPQEVCMWRRDMTTCDGLPMEECRDLVFERAKGLGFDEDMAMTIAEYAAIFIPLADDLEEVDVALRAIGAWISTLTQGTTADDIIHVTSAANDSGLLELSRDDFADEEAKLSYDAALEYYLAMADKAVCRLTLSGKDATVILEEEGVIVAIELEGSDWAIVCLVPHDGSGGWNGGGDPDPEPEPEPTPESPELLDA
jgi:hypothetical protein